MEGIAVLLIVFLLIWLVVRRRAQTNGGSTSIAIPAGVPEAAAHQAFDQIVTRFVAGEFATQFPSNALLKPGERLIFALPKIQLCEERVTKLGGSYSGVSIRVMKGVSYRTGSYSGASSTSVTPVDTGVLTLTSRRLLFIGTKQSRETPLSKIISIEALDHGVAIAQSGRQKTEYFTGTDVLKLEAKLTPDPDQNEHFDPTTITWRLTGEEIRKMIQEMLAPPSPALPQEGGLSTP